MRRTLLFSILFLAIGGLRTAAAQTPARPEAPTAPAPAVAPVGVYDFDAVLGNGSHALGRLVIKGQAGHSSSRVPPSPAHSQATKAGRSRGNAFADYGFRAADSTPART